MKKYIRHNPKDLVENKWKNVIEKERKKDRLLNALLLAHGYSEAYLLELLIYSGPVEQKKITRSILKDVEKLGFYTLLNMNLIIGNISFKLYKRMHEFNKFRNKIVHELIEIDIDSKQVEKRLKKQIKNAMFICEQLSKIYKKKIEERSDMVIKTIENHQK